MRDGALVLERIDGVTLLDELVADPSPASGRRAGRLLADLHDRLHQVPSIGPDPGCLLHLDLHPGNVLRAPAGPVVIDWTNARDGPAGLDVAMTWVILDTAAASGRPVALELLSSFLGAVDRADALTGLDAACAMRLADPNVSDAERAIVERLAVLRGEERS